MLNPCKRVSGAKISGLPERLIGPLLHGGKAFGLNPILKTAGLPSTMLGMVRTFGWVQSKPH